MSAHPSGSRSSISKVVEKQMRNWELARAQRVPAQPGTAPPPVAEFVSISRSVGSGGSEVAHRLGERLGWPVFDREILQAMAGDDQVRARLYEAMDEREQSWLESALRWIIAGEFREDTYFYRLNETVLALARRGRAVFLGRASDLILPRDCGLRVRITASLERRAATLAARSGMSETLARAEVEQTDADRAEFRRRHFGKNANDPTRFDLTVNMDRFTPPQAVEIILTALAQRGLLPPAPAASAR